MHHGELGVKENSGTLYTVYTAVYMYVCTYVTETLGKKAHRTRNDGNQKQKTSVFGVN